MEHVTLTGRRRVVGIPPFLAFAPRMATPAHGCFASCLIRGPAPPIPGSNKTGKSGIPTPELLSTGHPCRRSAPLATDHLNANSAAPAAAANPAVPTDALSAG